jgi:hypothetical protein
MSIPLAIIAELRNVLYWSQPNIKHDEMLSLIDALENALSPTEETIVEESVEEPTEEHVEDISESLSNILSLLETGAVEEPTVEVVAPKTKTTTRKK